MAILRGNNWFNSGFTVQYKPGVAEPVVFVGSGFRKMPDPDPKFILKSKLFLNGKSQKSIFFSGPANNALPPPSSF